MYSVTHEYFEVVYMNREIYLAGKDAGWSTFWERTDMLYRVVQGEKSMKNCIRSWDGWFRICIIRKEEENIGF